MNKHFLLVLVAIFAISCSKKVEIKGKIVGGSPLERIELINASSIATLPLTNLGVDKSGNFSGSFTASNDGMYVITYGKKQGMIYLESGQSLNITGNGNEFPGNFVITGEAKSNNDFIKATQNFVQQYASKVNMQQLIVKDEPAFLKEVQKINDDLQKNVDDEAKKLNIANGVKQWKKDDLNVSILGLLGQYQFNHGQATNNPSFKVSKNFTDFQKKYEADNDRLVENHPAYRNFLLSKMSEGFQKYYAAQSKNPNISTTEVFSKYLATQKDLSQVVKDYLLAFVITQSDIHPGTPKQNDDKIIKIIDTDIKNSKIKDDLKNLFFVVNGLKTGDQLPEISSLIKQDGSQFNLSNLKGKPTLIMFYASWNPYISESVAPVLKEVTNFYKSKMTYAYVNLDDTKDQFIKTSNAMLKGFSGTNVYAEGGMNSDLAKKLGIYGFKLPGFIVLNKEGKVEGKYFTNLGDSEIVTMLNKVSGLTAPQAPQQPPMQRMMPGTPQSQRGRAPQPTPQQAPQPAAK